MSKWINIIVLVSAAFSACTQFTLLEEGFKKPASSAKVRTWWYWMNGNISRSGITADLEATKEVGIEEAQLFNVKLTLPQGPVIYLSPEWLDLLKHAALEAKRLDMELAFPNPKENIRIENLDCKMLSGRVRNHLMPDTNKVFRGAIIDQANIVDLTDKVTEEGHLTWKPPYGEWVVMRIGHTPTGKKNHPAVAGGHILECDKISNFQGARIDANYLLKLDTLARLGSQAGIKTIFKMKIYGIEVFSWEKFWMNDDNMRETYLDAWRQVWERYKDNADVIGFNLANGQGKYSCENHTRYL